MKLLRDWVPAVGLLIAQLFQAASWLLAIWIAVGVGIAWPSVQEIAWIHTVALGGLTLAAFSMLLHLVPDTVGAQWRFGSEARGALLAAAIAVAAFVVCLLAFPLGVGMAAGVLAGALAVYLLTAAATLARAYAKGGHTERAIARAFGVALSVFAVVVLLGVVLAWSFSDAAFRVPLLRLPLAHANLAFFGWVTLLTYGVSGRVLFAITGQRTRWPLLHALYGSLTLLGALLLAAGTASDLPALAWGAGALLTIAAICYISDAADVLMRAIAGNRIACAFAAAALAWLALTIVVGAGVLAGAPWESAYGFLVLAGWATQMTNANVLHAGTRTIATIYRGPGDETPARALLEGRWLWPSFAATQIAVGVLAAGLLSASAALVVAGAVLGLLGWIAYAGGFFAAASSAAGPLRPIA